MDRSNVYTTVLFNRITKIKTTRHFGGSEIYISVSFKGHQLIDEKYELTGILDVFKNSNKASNEPSVDA